MSELQMVKLTLLLHVPHGSIKAGVKTKAVNTESIAAGVKTKAEMHLEA